VPARDFRTRTHGALRGGIAPDSRGVRKLHARRRAAVAGRSVSGSDRHAASVRFAAASRVGAQARSLPSDGLGGIGGDCSDQDGRQDPQRHVQTRRAAGFGPWTDPAVSRSAAGGSAVGRGAGDIGAPYRRGHRNHRRSGARRPGLARRPLRLAGHAPGRTRQWARPAAGHARLAAQVLRRGKHLRTRSGVGGAGT